MISIPPDRIPILGLKKSQKMMLLAKYIGETNKICYSRNIGSVLVDNSGIVIGTGYNGPPRKTPHTDSYEYYKDILWGKLTEEEKSVLYNLAITEDKEKIERGKTNPDELVASCLDGCRTCPRKLLGYKSGSRLDLCSCVHSEINSLLNCSSPTMGAILFGWCPVSCFSCSSQLINARVAEVHFLSGEVYDKGSLPLYKTSSIPVFTHSVEDFE